jgi:hypothetical protein
MIVDDSTHKPHLNHVINEEESNQQLIFINIVVNENDVNIKIIEEGKIREECKKSKSIMTTYLCRC